jgi:hypothetical protein
VRVGFAGITDDEVGVSGVGVGVEVGSGVMVGVADEDSAALLLLATLALPDVDWTGSIGVGVEDMIGVGVAETTEGGDGVGVAEPIDDGERVGDMGEDRTYELAAEEGGKAEDEATDKVGVEAAASMLELAMTGGKTADGDAAEDETSGDDGSSALHLPNPGWQPVPQ